MKKMRSQQELGFAVFCFARGIDNHFPQYCTFIVMMHNGDAV
jgi:hypothetical protein